MSLMVPDSVGWVLNLLGFTWPEADEDKLIEAGQHWRDLANTIDRIRHAANTHAALVEAGNAGSSIEAFSQYWDGIGGPGGHLEQIHQAAEVVADVLDGFAAVVVVAKADVIIQLGILAGELAGTTVAAIFTAGAAEAAAPEEIVASRFIVRQILDRIERHIEEAVAQRLRGEALETFKRLLASRLRGAVWGTAEGAAAGAATSTGVDLAVQEAEVHVLHTRDAVGFGEAVQAAEGGALFGAGGGAASGAIRKSEKMAFTGYIQGNLRDVMRGPAHIPADAIPRGFSTPEEFEQFSRTLNDGLERAGYRDAQAAFKGSSVTGEKWTTGKPFDAGRRSDFDIALGGQDVFQAAQSAGMKMNRLGGGKRTAPLTKEQLDALGLGDLHRALALQAGRDVNIQVYPSMQAVLGRGRSIVVRK